MGSKAWKKFEQSDGVSRLKLSLKKLIGKEPLINVDVTLPAEECCGWEIVAGFIQPEDIVYSFGICDEIGFEIAMVEQHRARVFAFDPTPFSVNWVAQQSLPAGLEFHPWAAAGEDGNFFLYPRVDRKGRKSDRMFTFQQYELDEADGVKVDAYTVDSAAKKLGHEKIDVLKMDVEGAEYGVLESLLASSLRPGMLLVEFHHRFKGIGKKATMDAITALRAADYLVASISATGREICLVRGEQAAAHRQP